MDEHHANIAKQLEKVGVTKYGMKKFAIRYLPKIIKSGENIKAAVYGRYRESKSSTMSAGVLVATNKHIIFLDHKPGFTSTDEIQYEMVSGVKNTSAMIFSSVILYTRMKEYSISFANNKCARKFVECVSSRI